MIERRRRFFLIDFLILDFSSRDRTGMPLPLEVDIATLSQSHNVVDHVPAIAQTEWLGGEIRNAATLFPSTSVVLVRCLRSQLGIVLFVTCPKHRDEI